MNSQDTRSPWIHSSGTEAPEAVRLLCFPYAGGGASAFRGWRDAVGNGIAVCPIQLPGRERRMRETTFRRMTPLATAIADAIASSTSGPYAFFGHSMGAMLAYETALDLRARGASLPVCLFLAGARAPECPRKDEVMYKLPDDKLIERLREFSGTPEEALRHPELMEILLPILRADFEVVETHVYRDAAPLECPIHAFAGEEDPEATADDMAPWINHTRGGFELHNLPGNHFFLHTATDRLLSTIRRQLQPCIQDNIEDGKLILSM